MNRRTTLGLTAAVLAALVLTGCSDDGEPEPTEEAGSAEARLTPLDAYFGDLNAAFDEEAMAEQTRRIEEVLAACMAEQGFEYIPVDYSTQITGISDDGLDAEWGSREFAEIYGYGVTTDPWGTRSAGTESFVDPNQAYLDAMSESELAAYQEAMYGDLFAGTEDVGGAFDWTTAGCQGEATHEVYGELTDLVQDPSFAALNEEMVQLQEQVERDGRVTSAVTAWTDCMADAGYPGFAALDDAQQWVYDAYDAIAGEVYADADPEQDPARTEEALLDRLEEDGLPEREIATAVADYDCQQTAGVADARFAAQSELEETFIETRKAELDALLAAYGSAFGE